MLYFKLFSLLSTSSKALSALTTAHMLLAVALLFTFRACILALSCSNDLWTSNVQPCSIQPLSNIDISLCVFLLFPCCHCPLSDTSLVVPFLCPLSFAFTIASHQSSAIATRFSSSSLCILALMTWRLSIAHRIIRLKSGGCGFLMRRKGIPLAVTRRGMCRLPDTLR